MVFLFTFGHYIVFVLRTIWQITSFLNIYCLFISEEQKAAHAAKK